MPHQNIGRLYTCLGFVIWGDLGPTTIYRNHRGKVVFFPKTWPDKPASEAQAIQRQRFVDAAAAWRNLSQSSHRNWETATRRASLCMNGIDLFTHWFLKGDDAAIETLERQTKTTLLPLSRTPCAERPSTRPTPRSLSLPFRLAASKRS